MKCIYTILLYLTSGLAGGSLIAEIPLISLTCEYVMWPFVSITGSCHSGGQDE